MSSMSSRSDSMTSPIGGPSCARRLAVAAALLLAGCSSMEGDGDKESVKVPLMLLPDAARATVTRLTAGGHLERIDKELEHGVWIYDVEATVGGRRVEYTVADADGAVLGAEIEIGLSDLPPAVADAAKAYFGTTSDLEIMKGDEAGATHFEIAGTKNGKQTEVTFDPTGRRVE